MELDTLSHCRWWCRMWMWNVVYITAIPSEGNKITKNVTLLRYTIAIIMKITITYPNDPKRTQEKKTTTIKQYKSNRIWNEWISDEHSFIVTKYQTILTESKIQISQTDYQ